MSGPQDGTPVLSRMEALRVKAPNTTALHEQRHGLVLLKDYSMAAPKWDWSKSHTQAITRMPQKQMLSSYNEKEKEKSKCLCQKKCQGPHKMKLAAHIIDTLGKPSSTKDDMVLKRSRKNWLSI